MWFLEDGDGKRLGVVLECMMRGLIGAGLLGGGGGGKDGTKESVGSIALVLLLDTQRSRVQLRKENVLVASIAVNLIWIQSCCCAVETVSVDRNSRFLFYP